MSRRNSTDPLLRAFLDTYKVNLLTIPREGAEVGDAYVAGKDGNTSMPGKLRFLLTPEIQMPKMSHEEKLTAIVGKRTRALDLDVGLKLLEGFLSAIGADIDIGTIKAEYQGKRVGSVRFELKDATRESVDAFEFGKALIPCQLNAAHPFVQEGNQYYAVVGVLRSRSITVRSEDANTNKVEVGMGALKSAVGIDNKLDVKRDAAGEITYEGRVPLAFGVELVEMRYDNALNKFFLAGITDPKVVRASGHGERRVFVGNPEEGEAFLRLG
jgi:hypothetical protein